MGKNADGTPTDDKAADKSADEALEEKEGGDKTPDGKEPKTLEEALAELTTMRDARKKFNSEDAKRRKRLTDLEKAESDRAAAALTETDRLKKDAADEKVKRQTAEAKYETERRHNAVLVAARKLKIRDPEDAWRLLDADALEAGEDGKLTGLDDALKALIKAKPYLVETADEEPPDINSSSGRGKGKTNPKDREAIVAQRFRIRRPATKGA